MTGVSDITVMAYALVAIALGLWKRELRWAWRWARRKWSALKVWVRHNSVDDLPPEGDLGDGWTYRVVGDIEAVEIEDGKAYFVMWPDEPPADDPWCTTPGEPAPKPRPKRKRRSKKPGA